MTTTPKQLSERLAVCSWSLQPPDPRTLLNQLQEVGVRRIQCALDPLREKPETWDSLPELCRQENIEIVSGMFVTAGEDYSTLDSIRRTGGLAPDSTWEENWENIQENAKIAEQLGLKLVTFHAGFMPHDHQDPAYESIMNRVRLVADLFAAKNIDVGLETGQETAATLREFLDHLGRPNVGVNFDPANMLLYDKGDPIEALRALGAWIVQCHVKDARKTRTPGTWGDEVPVGSGEVDWPAFFQALAEIQFEGDLAIEREAGEQRVADIRRAVEHLQSIQPKRG